MAATRPRWTAAAVATCLAIVGTLAACDPGPTPDRPPAPSNSTASKKDPSPSPTPTVSEQDQAYAAAEKAYTNANRIIDTAINEGAAKYPESLTDWVDPNGIYYQQQTLGLKSLHDKGRRFDGMSRVVAMFPPHGSVYNPNQISMYTCLDGRQVKTVDAESGEVVETGDLVAGVLVFKRTGEKGPDGLRTWRVWGYQNDKIFDVVDTCKEAPQ